MTTTTINAGTNSGSFQSSRFNNYEVARAGTGTTAATTSNYVVGQDLSSGIYLVYETFLEFDTSALPDDAVLDSATLKLYVTADNSAVDFTLEARADDYGTSLTTADWVPGANLAGLTLLASLATTGITASAYNSFAENGANFRSAVSLSGATRLMVSSSRTRTDTAPTTTDEFVDFDTNTGSNPPQLVIAYHITSTRTVSSTARLTATLTRVLTGTARLMQVHTRTLNSTARLTNRFTRTLSSTARLSGAALRSVASTARLRGSETRTVSSTARLTVAQRGPLAALMTTDGATHASANGASYAVTTGSRGTKARID